jgi:hypothetical protein
MGKTLPQNCHFLPLFCRLLPVFSQDKKAQTIDYQ